MGGQPDRAGARGLCIEALSTVGRVWGWEDESGGHWQRHESHSRKLVPTTSAKAPEVARLLNVQQYYRRICHTKKPSYKTLLLVELDQQSMSAVVQHHQETRIPQLTISCHIMNLAAARYLWNHYPSGGTQPCCEAAVPFIQGLVPLPQHGADGTQEATSSRCCTVSHSTDGAASVSAPACAQSQTWHGFCMTHVTCQHTCMPPINHTSCHNGRTQLTPGSAARGCNTPTVSRPYTQASPCQHISHPTTTLKHHTTGVRQHGAADQHTSSSTTPAGLVANAQKHIAGTLHNCFKHAVGLQPAHYTAVCTATFSFCHCCLPA